MSGSSSLRLSPFKFIVAILFGLILIPASYGQTAPAFVSESELYRNVVRAIGRKDYAEAITLGSNLIERTNKYGQVYFRMVQAARASGRLEQVSSAFRSLIDMSPPNPGGYYGIGLINSEEKNYPEAIKNYQKCIELREDFLSPILALVDAHLAEGKIDDAETYIKSLIRLRPKNSAAHLGLGYCYLMSGRTDDALEETEMALSQMPILAEACYYHLNTLYLVGKHRDLVEMAYKCLPAVETEMNDEHWQAYLNLIAANQFKLRNYPEAERLFNQALELARNMGDKGYEEVCLGYLALIREEQSDYSQALLGYQRAIEVAQTSISPKSATNLRRYLGRLGSIYRMLGDFPTALQYFQIGLAAARKWKDEDLEALLETYIGDVFIAQHNIAQAIDHYKRAVEINEKLRDRYNRNSAFDGLPALYMQTGEYQKAKEVIERGLKQARELSYFDRVLVLLNRSGELELRLNESGRAIEAYQEALRLASDKNNPSHAWTACAGLAMVYKRQGLLDRAREHYQMAIEIMERVRANLGGEDERAGFFQDKVEVYKNLIAVLMRLNDKDSTKHYDVEAFHIAERGRARAFLDLLTESKVSSELNLGEAMAKRQQEIEERISKLTAQLIAEKSNDPEKWNKERIAKLEAERNQADLDRQDWAREARQRNPDYKGLKYPEPLSLEQTQKMLDDDSILLSYSLGEDQSYLFAVTRNAFQVKPLIGAAAIRENVEKLVSAIADGNTHSMSSYRQRAVKLYQQLIDPVSGMIKGKKELIIAPDGALHRLPFEVLLPASALKLTQPDFRKLPYLIKDYAISYTPSASVLGGVLDYRRDTSTPQKAFVAYADPAYGKDELDGNSNLALVTRGAWQEGKPLKFNQLANSRNEAKGIAALFPEGQADVFVGPDATEENVKAPGRLSQYQMIHFAAHGLLNTNRPRFSGIVLSLPQGARGGQSSGSKEDGILQAYEIFNLKLNADLVSLSACETGLGKEVNGEGMMSLIRAFMYAGTPSVIASLWNIDDKKSADLMIRFYRHLKGGQMSKARALQQAQIETIAESSSPYFWAPFILVGRSN